MNQILVTEKVYVTPELKRKKKMYKFLFILSIFSIISLFSVYIYAEYDRSKDESISDEILSFMTDEEDDTTVSSYENALVVKITQDIAEEIEDLTPEETNQQEQPLQMATATSTLSSLKYKHARISAEESAPPGCPLFAFSTAAAARMRMLSAARVISSFVFISFDV